MREAEELSVNESITTTQHNYTAPLYTDHYELTIVFPAVIVVFPLGETTGFLEHTSDT